MKLYRFEPDCKQRINSIKEGKLWMSKPSSFNDPFDCKPTINYDDNPFNVNHNSDLAALKAVYEKYDSSKSLLIDDEIQAAIMAWCNEESSNELVSQLIQNKIQNFGVKCFFRSGFDNPVMWAHYAENHKGFCVEYEYDWKRSLKVGNDDKFLLSPVTYTSGISAVDLMQVLIKPDLALKQLLTCKASEWSYEQETRLIYFPMCKKKAGECVDLPSSLNVSAIYSGIAAESIGNDLQEAAQTLGVELYQMKMTEFGLDADPTQDST